MILKRKKVIFLGVIVLIILISLRIYLVYLKISMPNFNFRTIDGIILSKKESQGYRTTFLFVEYLNSLTKFLLQEIINCSTGNDKIIIINKNVENELSKLHDNAVFIIENKSWIQAVKKFRLPIRNENRILVYNKNFDLEINLPIKGKNKIKILDIYINPKMDPSKGNVENILSNIKRELLHLENGYYYITEGLNTSCLCFLIYQKMEKNISQKKDKLNLILIGEWSRLDIENLLIERNNLISICLADQKTNQMLQEWMLEAERPDFNLIAIKSEDEIDLFPLLSLDDYNVWFNNESRILKKIL